MEREILAYIKQNRMIGKNDVVLAGVSGGSDSMAMLRILKELQGKLDFTLRVVHIHHGIRGKEADRDQSFVENICRKWQIPCTVYCYDVPGLSREWKLGEEETGRIVRKEAFQREAAVCGRKDSEIKIALAHNQEDLAETMLHNLCRGTGLRGLCTMRPVDGEIIRPILCLSRDKIAEYLKEKKISHIQDSTNLSDEYTRNRIRHHILPILEQQVNGKAAAHMAETAARISQAEEYLTQQSCRVLGEFQKGKEYYFTEKFFMEPQIIQVYALQQAMEQLAGRRKDLVRAHKIVEAGLAHVPEGRHVFLHMTVEENLDMGAYTQPASTIAPNKEKVFELFPRLKERRKQLAGTMSGGEQQMLAMGRALMSNASMLMLDEPSMGLSPLLVQEIFDIIQNVHKEGMTILLVEQNAQMALSVADRAYVLETGRVVMEGTGAELLTNERVRSAYLGG